MARLHLEMSCRSNLGLFVPSPRLHAFTRRTIPTSATAAIASRLAFHTSASRDSRSHHSNHYEHLGLSQSATKREIKSQFYKLSKLHHPDKSDTAESRKAFLSINEAYSVLGNDRHRRDYDLTLLDKSGSLYSNNSSSTSPHTRGTLRRTPFRHSAQSAAAAAAARTHAAFRPNFGAQAGGGPVPHFDSKSHQEMHYEQDIRREERRQARERAKSDQQRFDESETGTGKIFRAAFVFMMVVISTSFMRAFADELEEEKENEETFQMILEDCLRPRSRYHSRRYSEQLRLQGSCRDAEFDFEDPPSAILSALRSTSSGNTSTTRMLQIVP